MNDVLFNILLYSDIQTIKNYNMIKNNVLDKHFWVTKFNQDHLPLLSNPFNTIEWIKEYIKIDAATIRANDFMPLYTMDTRIMITYNETQKPLLIKYLFTQEDYHALSLHLGEKNKQLLVINNKGLHYTLYKSTSVYPAYRNIININDIKQLLIKVFYQIPEIRIMYTRHINTYHFCCDLKL